jgi:hypothetical protein
LSEVGAANGFFQARLEQTIDLRHSLAVPAGGCRMRKLKRRRRFTSLTTQRFFRHSVIRCPRHRRGRPMRLPIRLMASLLYLCCTSSKHSISATKIWRRAEARTPQGYSQRVGRRKARKPCEFGVKTSVAVTQRGDPGFRGTDVLR